jgi:hypothetical protein
MPALNLPAPGGTPAGPRHRAFASELLEPRRLMSVTGWTGSYITDLSGADYFGTVLYGDNGDPWGSPTASAGNGGADAGWSYAEWDAYLDDGLDSGWRSVSFSLNTSGTGQLGFDVAGESISYSAGAPTSISSVTIRAAVLGAELAMDWANLNVGFYQNGQLVETVQPSAISASTMNAGNNNPRETVIVMTPNASNCNGVLVTGNVRLRSAAGTYPNPNDIFADIRIS